MLAITSGLPVLALLLRNWLDARARVCMEARRVEDAIKAGKGQPSCQWNSQTCWGHELEFFSAAT